MYFNTAEFHFPLLPLDFPSLSRQVHQLFAPYFQGAVHGRKLHLLSCKSHEDRADVLFRHIHFAGLKYFPRNILCIGHGSKEQHSSVCLGTVAQLLHKPCRFSQTDREHALRIRIERAGMSYFLLIKYPSHPGHDTERRHAFLFPDDDHSVNHSCSRNK